MTRIIQTIGVAVVTLGIATPMAAAQYSHAFALQRFTEQVAAYMALRDDVAQNVPPPTISGNASDIFAVQEIWADAIRKARPRAKAGDIFNAAVGVEFRRRIDSVLTQHSVGTTGFASDLQREFPDTPPLLTVNAAFDWRFGAMMPIAIIQALPEVPWPLQYRFVSHDLVLLDVDAGLIVDILPDALEAP